MGPLLGGEGITVPTANTGRSIMTTAADLMTTNVLTVKPDMLVNEVAGLILNNRITALPVADETGELLGIVSEGDLIRCTKTKRDAHRSWWLNLLTKTGENLNEMHDQGQRKVEEVMSRDVLIASDTDGLTNLIDLLSRRRIKRLPIVKDGKLVGIVSRVDILRYLAKEKVQF